MDIVKLANFHRIAMSQEFLDWLPTNTHIYPVFEQLADLLWSLGRRHYSSRTIGEKMRFDHSVRSSDEYKLRNSVTPYLGRVYVLMHPERVDFFKYQKDDTGFYFPDYVEFCKSIGTV